MSRTSFLIALGIVAAPLLAACDNSAKLPESAGIGPNPRLPAPNPERIPTVDIAPAKPWSVGTKLSRR